MERIKFDQYEKGATIPELEHGPIAHMDLVRYAGASGDFNPIHTDPAFAEKVGLGGTIAHGMYIMALLGRLATNWVHPAQIKSYGVKFKGMTRPGQNVKMSGSVKRVRPEEKELVVAIQAALDDGSVAVAGELVIAAD
ncbi:MAG: dehydratase [Leptospiraceae bacterium]|nr:dehydratase [Leptospiraceae bacterium]